MFLGQNECFFIEKWGDRLTPCGCELCLVFFSLNVERGMIAGVGHFLCEAHLGGD